jgi:segregation and condensation protein B
MNKKSPARLSRAALETLAIIAYRQPVLRAEVDKIRGVDTGGMIKTLLEKELVRVVGRKDLPGRPIAYGTTRKFLETFDLPSLEALPSIEEMESLGQANESRLF